MFLETQKNKNRFREIKEQKSPHSVPKGKGKITALCAKGPFGTCPREKSF
jgi:hypothetical protein